MTGAGYGLTPRQRDAYAFIVAHPDTSFAELAAALRLPNSNSSPKRLVDALVERGYLSRLPRRARSLTPLKPVPGPRLRVVFGPAYFAAIAWANRAQYAREAA